LYKALWHYILEFKKKYSRKGEYYEGYRSMSKEVATKDEIKSFLIDMFIKEKNISIENLSPERPLKELDIDSFGFLEVIFSIEHQYNISFPKNYEHLVTIQDVIDVTHDLVVAKQ
jgi:acyl carrier protein